MVITFCDLFAVYVDTELRSKLICTACELGHVIFRHKYPDTYEIDWT